MTTHKPAQCCGNCQHARWNKLTATGRIAKYECGRCAASADITVNAPACITKLEYHRGAIWPDDGAQCTFHEMLTGPRQKVDGSEPHTGVVRVRLLNKPATAGHSTTSGGIPGGP